MQIGLTSPIVTAVPGQFGEWELSACPDDLRAIAEAADGLGLHHLTCSEHVAVPTAVASSRGATYWDPLATLSFLAACTTRVRLVTHVLVLGYHHPLALAKSYGTLDVLSGGRVVLGVGVGSLAEEFELLGKPFEGRGVQADADLRALRASLSRERPDHPAYSDFVVSPHAVQKHVPIWVGGRTMRSLRRAVELGDGWAPFGLPLEELARMLAGVELPEGFEVVLAAPRPVDPLGDHERYLRTLEKLAAAGATIATVAVSARSRQHYVDQLAAVAEGGGSS